MSTMGYNSPEYLKKWLEKRMLVRPFKKYQEHIEKYIRYKGRSSEFSFGKMTKEERKTFIYKLKIEHRKYLFIRVLLLTIICVIVFLGVKWILWSSPAPALSNHYIIKESLSKLPDKEIRIMDINLQDSTYKKRIKYNYENRYSIIEYKNGVKHGVTCLFTENSEGIILRAKIIYNYGTILYRRSYYETGSTQSFTRYNDSKPCFMKFYYKEKPNKLFCEGKVIPGKTVNKVLKVGDWTYYNLKGEGIKKRNFKKKEFEFYFTHNE